MFVPPILHLSTGGSRLRMGNEGVETSNAFPHPPPTLNPSSKGRLCKHGLPIGWVEPPELRGQAAAQVVVVQVPARGAPKRDHGGTAANAEGGKCDARASPCTPPPSVPSHPLRCHGLEAGVPRCGGSQVCQRGKQPKLRGHAAAQAAAVKVPARGAPERDHGGTTMRAEGGKCDARASLTAPSPSVCPTPTLPRLGGGGAEVRRLTAMSAR